jgi:CubicO group peptidase (beta-lactamase class C family)
VQEGKLAYTDTLAHVLPNYPDKEAAQKITVHHLLTHTSGLGDIFTPEFFAHKDQYRKPTDYFPLFAHQPLRFEPGAGWSYSNAGFVVLGAIIERLSGRSFFDEIRDHVFRPAGMNDSGYFGVDEVTPNRAEGYTRAEEDVLGIEPRRSNVQTLPLRGSPAGGCYSTAPDLFRFAQALRSHKLLRPELTETITRQQAKGPGGATGYGFEVQEINGKAIVGHGGGAPGMNTDLRIFLDGSYTIVILGNYDPPAAQMLGEQIPGFGARQ